MRKRGFLKTGILATGAVLCHPLLYARDTGPGIPSSLRVTAVIYDRRYRDSREFAMTLAREGALPLPAQDDLATLWHGAPGRLLARPGCRVAGLSCYSDFALLRDCPAMRSLRLIYAGMHDARGSSRLTHRLEFPGNGPDPGELPEREWARRLALVLRGWQGGPEQVTRRTCSTPRGTDHPGTLYSWLLG